jgi:hypothetical protein
LITTSCASKSKRRKTELKQPKKCCACTHEIGGKNLLRLKNSILF